MTKKAKKPRAPEDLCPLKRVYRDADLTREIFIVPGKSGCRLAYVELGGVPRSWHWGSQGEALKAAKELGVLHGWTWVSDWEPMNPKELEP